MDELKVPAQCYLHPHIEKRWINDKVGWGLFAKSNIIKGETVTIISGITMTKSKIVAAAIPMFHWLEKYSIEIDDNLIIYPTLPLNDVFYMNHSCSPNVGNGNVFTTVAMRDIRSSEQITYDYATTDTNDIFERGEMKCFCGVIDCRGVITGDDWINTELQEKYKGYFQPHIQRKIDELKQIPE